MDSCTKGKGVMDMGKLMVMAGIAQSVGNQNMVMPDGFWDEWNRVCQRFRKYQWVKEYGPGVYKLAPMKGGRNAIRNQEKEKL